MTKLCPRGKAAAKRKFAVYPSAYANAYASKICAGKIKDPSGVKRKDFKGPKKAALGAMMIGKKMVEEKMPIGGAAMALRKKLMGKSKGGGADMSKVKTKKAGPAGGLKKRKRKPTMLDEKGFQLKYPNRGSGPNNPVVMYSVKKGGFPDLSGDGKTTMKDILIGRGVIKKKSGGSIDKNVRVIDLQKQGKTSKKGIRVKGKGKSFMDVYKKTVYNRADGGMVPFGGEKRVPGSGAATRGTGFKGIF